MNALLFAIIIVCAACGLIGFEIGRRSRNDREAEIERLNGIIADIAERHGVPR